MQRQGFKPDVYALQTNIYTPSYVESGGAAVEGTQIPVNSVLLEEIDQHPELQKYAQWLNQVKPGAKPTGLGMYAWGAAIAFVDALKKVGPKPTRKAVVEELKKIRGFTGNKMLPPQDIGNRNPADCVIMVELRKGKWVRIAPNQGYMCSKPTKV
jgi:hypothetical protein